MKTSLLRALKCFLFSIKLYYLDIFQESIASIKSISNIIIDVNRKKVSKGDKYHYFILILVLLGN